MTVVTVVTAATVVTLLTVAIALFILLPVMRFILMSGVFLHQRDYRFGTIAALLPAIAARGLVAGAAGNARNARALV
ncbi:hypothetical protein [Paraburkholderia xenovorans]